MKIAVIDFSSTSLSLLVEEVSGEMMVPVVGLRRSVSILGYMSKKGKLSERGIEKVVDSIRYLMEAAAKVGTDSVHIISTASMRIIRNYGEVAEAIKAGTGLPVNNLDGQAEAYADYIANREYTALGSTMLLDIGGYSSSFIDMDNSSKDSMFTLDIGPAALFQTFDGMYPDKDNVKRMRHQIDKTIEKNSVFPEKGFKHIVLTGSNAEALYAVYADHYSIPDSSFKTMARKKLRKMIKHLIASDERSLILIRNVPEKVHTLIPSAILAEEIASIFSTDELIISDKGVKDGYLRILMEENSQESADAGM